MAWPVIVAAAALAYQAYSDYQQKQAQEGASKVNYELAGKQADLQEEQAKYQMIEGEQAAATSWGNTLNLEEAQIGAYTARGVSAFGSTPLALLQQTRDIGKQDYEAILNSAKRKSQYMSDQAELMRQGANIQMDYAQNQAQAGYTRNTINTGLTALNLYNQYYGSSASK